MKLFKILTRWADGNETETIGTYEEVSMLMNMLAIAFETTGNEDIPYRAVFISIEEIINLHS